MCIRDRPSFIARWKTHGRLSIRINWNFFRYLLLFRRYESKCVQLGCFRRGSTSLHSHFTWTRSSPSTIFGIRKPETLGYPKVKTASLCVSSFWHNTGVWRTDGQMDGRICRSIYSACKASFAERFKTCLFCRVMLFYGKHVRALDNMEIVQISASVAQVNLIVFELIKYCHSKSLRFRTLGISIFVVCSDETRCR